MAIGPSGVASATPTTRTRTRPSSDTPPAGGGGWMRTGSEAIARGNEEVVKQQERAKGNFAPFRFFVPLGESTDIVILDSELGPCFYEHHMQDNRGKWTVFETCPKEWESCPLCDGTGGAKESYYVMVLTVAVLKPYVDKHGKERTYTKMLLPVKAAQQKFFHRQFERYGTLRGLQFLMTRDTKMGASIGQPEFVAQHTEEDIIATFGHTAVTAQDGRVLKPENADCFPFDYMELFPKPSAADLRKRYGGAAPTGSREETADVWGGDDDDNSIPF